MYGLSNIKQQLSKEMNTAIFKKWVEFLFKNKDESTLMHNNPKAKQQNHSVNSENNVRLKSEIDLGLNGLNQEQLAHKLLRIQEEFKFINENKIRYQKLTKREKEIIKLLANGYNNPKIAAVLFISRNTVEQHRKNINKKLLIKSFSHLMSYSYAFNII
jgi:DNA-binding CsgD family transcriptional regulator